MLSSQILLDVAFFFFSPSENIVPDAQRNIFSTSLAELLPPPELAAKNKASDSVSQQLMEKEWCHKPLRFCGKTERKQAPSVDS